jgi:hypothetical protein
VDPTLNVRVEGAPGAIPARAFIEVLRTSLDVLDQLERAENVAAKPPGGWLISELQNSSAVAVLRRPDAPSVQSPLRLVEGLALLKEQQELPPYFSPDVARDLVRIGGQMRLPGVSGVTFGIPAGNEVAARQEQVTEAVLTNARASVEETETTIGSVTGMLDVINLRRGAHIVSLYDEETRRAVRCKFPEALFETVKSALGHRVRALGAVTRNRRGQVLRVDIDRVEAMPDAPGAPSVDELAGIAPWYTGEQSTEDYLRSVRGA